MRMLDSYSGMATKRASCLVGESRANDVQVKLEWAFDEALQDGMEATMGRTKEARNSKEFRYTPLVTK